MSFMLCLMEISKRCVRHCSLIQHATYLTCTTCTRINQFCCKNTLVRLQEKKFWQNGLYYEALPLNVTWRFHHTTLASARHIVLTSCRVLRTFGGLIYLAPIDIYFQFLLTSDNLCDRHFPLCVYCDVDVQRSDARWKRSWPSVLFCAQRFIPLRYEGLDKCHDILLFHDRDFREHNTISGEFQ